MTDMKKIKFTEEQIISCIEIQAITCPWDGVNFDFNFNFSLR